MTDVSTNALSSLFAAVGGVSFEELTAQAEVATASSGYNNPNAGKIKIVFAKRDGFFELPDMTKANLAKPEEKRSVIKAKRIKGVIVQSHAYLQNWPKDANSPACKLVSFRSPTPDPQTRAQPIIDGYPNVPTEWKNDFIRKFEPIAMRREEVVDAATGQTTTTRTKLSCLDCLARGDGDNAIEDQWYKKCSYRGSIDFIIMEIDGEPVEVQAVCFLDLPSTSLMPYATLVKECKTKYNVLLPVQLITELQVQKEKGKDGSPYEKIKFIPTDKLKEDQAIQIAGVYTDFQNTKQVTAGAGAQAKQIAAPATAAAAKPAVADAGSADEPAAF